MSVRDFLIRGLLAGLLAGLAAFAVASVVGEPSMRAAIAIEQAGETASHDSGTEGSAATDQVPRSLQSTLGLLTGTLVEGAAVGGLAGVLCALALGRLGGLGVRGTALAIAGIGFLSVYVMPYVAYPPNPPGIGQGDTIGYRTALYFILVAICLVAAVTAIMVGVRLAHRWGAWWAGLTALACFLAETVTAVALMPAVDEVPASFPATVLFEFRMASFATQLTLWAVLGVALAELGHRLVRSRRPRPSALVGTSA